MRIDAAPSDCDVIGCAAAAVGSYLHSRDSQLLEFSICADHYARLQNGQRPVIAADPELANPDGRPALLVEDVGPPH